MTGSHKELDRSRSSRPRRIAGQSFLFLSLIFSMLLAACSGGGGTTTTNNGGSSSVLKVVAAPKGPNVDLFNPYDSSNQGSTWGTQGLLYEPLWFISSYDSSEKPWLASSYSFNSDVTALTFKLRTDVKWNDGTQFTSADVKFTFDEMKKYPALDTGAVWASRLSSVTTPDASTVVFNLQHPDSTALYRLGVGVYIVPQHIWSSISGDPAKFTNDQNPVGTGPYKLASFRPELVKYTVNPTYWGTKPAIKEVDVPQAADNATAAQMISKGEIDWSGVGWDPGTDAGFSKKDPQHNHTFFSGSNTVTLYMNLQKAPFNNLAFRQAVSLAINRPELYQKGNIYAPPASQSAVVTPNFNSWVSPKYAGKQFPTDDANYTQAWKLLGQAGYTKDANGMAADASGKELSFSLLDVNGWTDWVADSQLLQNDLAKIGITTTINTVGGYPPYYNALQSGNYDAAISWEDGGPTPYYPFFDMLSSTYSAPAGQPITGGTNFERWSDPATDKLLSQYSTSADLNTQKQAIYGIEDIIANQLPVIPLTINVWWAEYTTNNIKGWPSATNPYDIAAPYQAPDLENVVLHLQPNS
jgi:peptide/nickel transport system substrate-binding protein